MNEERTKILNMLSHGKISVEEADKLLEALKKQKTLDRNLQEETQDKMPSYLYIQVESKVKGQEKVDIRIPLKLMRAGMQLASLMPEKVQEKVNHAMNEKGLDFNIKKLHGHDLDKFLLTLSDFHINVDSDKETVKIFCK